MLKYLFIALFFFIIGSALSFATPIKNTAVYSGNTLGAEIQSHSLQIIGFQPYWLFSTANTTYHSYIHTFSYFGLVINTDGSIKKLTNHTEEEPGWTTLNLDKTQSLLKQLSDHKVQKSLVIHLASEDDIIELMKDPKVNAQTLLKEIIPIMENNSFTNLNIDIESFIAQPQERRKAFTTFVQKISEAVHKKNITLTLSVAPKALTYPFLTDIPSLSKYTDTFVFMTYDYHYTGSSYAGPVAPIGGAGENREMDVETSIQEALKILPSQKVYMGVPFYGYEWDTLSNIPGSPTVFGTGKTASNRRITNMLKDCATCITGIEKEGQQPYVITPSEDGKYFIQYFYEDAVSLQKKIDLAKKYKLGGIAIWALGYEDASMRDILEKQIKN
ncbi:MAG: glycosyl hydrolase family 18 protein [Candidatus Roizmanbacteria bacterium]